MITSLNHLLKVYLTRSALPRPVDVQLTNGQIDKDDLKFRTDDMDKSDMSSPPATGSTGSQADGTDETLFQSAQAERPSNPEVLCALNINISEDVATFRICVFVGSDPPRHVQGPASGERKAEGLFSRLGVTSYPPRCLLERGHGLTLLITDRR